MPNLDYAQWAVAGLYGLVLIAAGISDFRVRKIPNWTVIAIAVLYIAWALVNHAVDWQSGLMAFGIALAGSFALYLLKVVGAGDSKLFTVAALFAGMKLLGALALATALIGGVIALGVMLVNPKRVLRGLTPSGREELKKGRGIPYGVPIALAGLLVMFAPFGATHDPSTANLPQAGQLLPAR